MQIKETGERLPFRRLNYFAIGRETAVISYSSGGFAAHGSTVVFRIKGERIIGVMNFFGPHRSDPLTRSDVLQFLLNYKFTDRDLYFVYY